PKEERYSLRSQTRDSAVSVSSNIAEGHARQGREFAYFLSIARGSIAECESQLLFAVEVGYLKLEDLKQARSLASEIRRMASSLSAKIGAAQLEKIRLGNRRRDKILTPDP
ncbi:MAG TPA: four helix bundle protein, partial [Planctomycetota bacterium]|nr:four helix bundle protein [Planctomycetota bacterium]